MSILRKRLASNTDFGGANDDKKHNAFKRQKLSIIFSNKADHRNFLQFYDAIRSAPLIDLLDRATGSGISCFIAEYAFGFVSDCLNIKCSDKIIRLRQDYYDVIY